MSDINENKSAGQKLREAFWEKKRTRKLSPELKEIFESASAENLKKEESLDKKVARPKEPEVGA